MSLPFFLFDGHWILSDLLDPACEIRERIMTQLDISGDNPARGPAGLAGFAPAARGRARRARK
jgi:hypothetical protein